MICSDLLKYYHYILCFLDDRPSTDVRDTDATKGQGNVNSSRKIDRLERSRQQMIKEMELLREEISILQDISPKDEVYVLGGREKYP